MRKQRLRPIHGAIGLSIFMSLVALARHEPVWTMFFVLAAAFAIHVEGDER